MTKALRLLAIAAVLLVAACSTGLDTQMENVLADMESEIGYVNTFDDEAVAKVASWFERHGDDSQKARALYCLGRNLYNSHRYSAAIVSYTKALGYATDTLQVARIHYDMARTSAATMNASDEALYLGKAAQGFEAAGRPSESRMALIDLGKSRLNIGESETAEEIFKSVLADSHELRDTLLEVRCLEAYAEFVAQEEGADPSLAIIMLSRAADDLGYPLSCQDKGILAYSYSLLGNIPEAKRWLSEAKASAETDAEEADIAFREYQVSARSGETAKALAALEKVVDYGNMAQAEALSETVAANQREYLLSQAEAREERLRSDRTRLALLTLAAVLAIIVLIILEYVRRSEEKRRLEAQKTETDKYMSIAEDLRKQLSSKGKKKNHGSDALERLCEQYYVYEGTDNLQPRVLKEVKSIISGLRSDAKTKKELEDLLDENMDGVMTKLREDFPSWKEEDYTLYCLTASGFSSTTISTLMEKDKKVIYNKVWRMKGKISSSSSPRKDFFLNCLD